MPYILYDDRGIKKSFALPEDKMVVFGREDHVEFQILRDSLVSREHFAIDKDDAGDFVLVELGASNGTFLNDNQLEANSITKLKTGDRIRAGRQNFIYSLKPAKKSTTTSLVKDVLKDIDKKDYKTLMNEIVSQVKK
ncbi:MAG: FHA domain-containing protein [Kiritimatiellaeota bacterium]|nr:FHA domain-containing protein [Kiritimatiellota bacterium]